MTTGDKPLGPAEIEQIRLAVAAVGESQPDDYRRKIDEQARALGPAASRLKRILECDPLVRWLITDYDKFNERAITARHRFTFAVTAISVVAVAAAMLALFLIAVPPIMEWPVRVTLSVVAGIALVTLPSELRAALWLEEKIGWPIWLLRLGLTAGLAWALYTFVIPVDFTQVIKPLQVILTGLFLACAVAADAVSGGATARVLQMFTGFHGRSLHRGWYEARGRAEASRRLLFLAVLNAEPPKPEGTAAGDPVPLLSQQLEYFRRYQIEVQQAYYTEQSDKNQRGSQRAERARLSAFLVFLGLAIVALLTLFAKVAEQGGGYLPDYVTMQLLEVTQRGWDDVAVLLTLFALGAYIVLQMKSSLLRERVNHRRYGNALGQLRQITSPEPGRFEVELSNPLADARKAAVRDQRKPVEHFMHDVNRLLAAEVGDWNVMTPYALETTADNASRLLSAEKLSAEDFDRVARDLGSRARRARKISFVAAREAKEAEHVETRFNGKESHNTAGPGDWIVTNMDAERQIIRDAQNCANTYVIQKARFPEVYDLDTGTVGDFGDVYKAKGVVDAVALPGGFDIVAPWGQRQQAASGYLLRNGTDVYGIHSEAYDRTYEVVA